MFEDQALFQTIFAQSISFPNNSTITVKIW